MTDPSSDVRLDKWLWAARFFSARNLARQAIESGRVVVGGQRVKPARLVRIGDELRVRIGDDERIVRVLAISDRRGPAAVARTLYEESAESIERRERRREQHRWAADPAESIEGGRPTKRDRRRLSDWSDRG
ncbi:MAG TPA: S4 domain-containing protein [Zeimonas sp.]|nr:S4 domain-containing protein [Zeimonas sp.]